MFSNKECSGHHLIIDLKECNNHILINSVDACRFIFEEICITFDFTVLNRAEHVFYTQNTDDSTQVDTDGVVEVKPCGYTLLYMLSESHISIHTFPEKKFASFDLYSCRNYENTKEITEIKDFVIDVFGSMENEHHILKRDF